MRQSLIVTFASLVVLAGCASTEAVTDEANLDTDASAVVTEEATTAETELEMADAKVEEASSKADSSREVCKTIEVTGSRIARKRICRSAAQWEAIEDATENNLRRRMRNTSLGN